MIRVENLRKLYPNSVAVDDVSFSVSDNEILGFLGPNGAGKTTTLRMLVGYLPPTSGKVIIDNIDVTDDPDSVHPLVGYMPENVVLYPELKVREYLTYRARIKGISRQEVNSEIVKVMEDVFYRGCGKQAVFYSFKGIQAEGRPCRCAFGQSQIHSPG